MDEKSFYHRVIETKTFDWTNVDIEVKTLTIVHLSMPYISSNEKWTGLIFNKKTGQIFIRIWTLVLIVQC